ncbi:methyltransferase family protein [Thermosporothrix hazakensis]|jgi:ubiquinone/menaquinone biosynthesis C-methylase UbiE|uniref:Methyltransferase family protein n=2 Tax=Thermosporothrix TaxID=768650 RepID=A0A326U4J2_THEHA|nr:methyltransferase domain-containing protein [Thermosporothrix hazakensis]PZW26701.1 methyltransferase family protein [Thermosporothrix hazakensis]BBH89416.1 hypothetical protein KTC_41670 [Thermosporothrix sp. COM3]GCE47599.1 hypothetical protein KTH_24680 [Thermosporothrix hazakensis]
MAVNRTIHANEYGLPLNATQWLETHHASKASERQQMIRDLQIKKGSFLVDAGCGPGLWTPLLAEVVGAEGHILGIDISTESLVLARQRSNFSWYNSFVQYKKASLDRLPLDYGVADIIFSANVSQYLPEPVSVFAAMGPYLKDGGRLVIKDIDFGTLRFHNIDTALQARVFQARERWEQERVHLGYAFEDSWVGSKLASYLHAAGYTNIQERTYTITRKYPLPQSYIHYIQGIADWFICEGAPHLSTDDVQQWWNCFFSEASVLQREDFVCEETEFVVTGEWHQPSDNVLQEVQIATISQ